MLPTTQIDATLLLGLKLGIVLVITLYTIFATIVVRQVSIMTKTLEVGFETPLRLISVLHLLMSIFILLLSIFL